MWLIELKVLLASTSRAASVSSSWKLSRTECTAPSHPDIWPVHSCVEPAASCTSSHIIARTAFVMIRLAVYWAYSRTLVKGDQPAGQKGSKSPRVKKLGA